MWVIQFASDQASAVAAFRHASGTQLLVEDAHVWLRGTAEQPDKDTRRKLAPDANHFRLEGSHLILEGDRVPIQALPTGEWRGLGESIEFLLPVVERTMGVGGQLQVRLVREGGAGTPSLARRANKNRANDDHDVSPAMVLLPFGAFADYVEMAPEVRLRRWSFVVSARGDCLVRGEPLPPLPGVFFIERERVAVPVGYGWTPRVDAATLRERCGAAGDELLLWREDGALEVIDLLDFSRVSRAVVRAARERLPYG